MRFQPFRHLVSKVLICMHMTRHQVRHAMRDVKTEGTRFVLGLYFDS